MSVAYARDPLMRPQPTLLQQTTAEFLGTFVLVFVGCGAIVGNALSGGAVTHVGVALCFGGAVAAMVVCFGPVSGCHINPAVTLGLWVAGAQPTRRVVSYVTAQLIGAVAAAALLRWMLGDVARVGATLPMGGHWPPALVIEAVLTLILMLVVCASEPGSRSPGLASAVAIGLVYTAAVLAMGPIGGGSMNPARSFGPALLSRTWDHQWLYWVGPIVGALLGVGASRVIGPGVSSPGGFSARVARRQDARRPDIGQFQKNR